MKRLSLIGSILALLLFAVPTLAQDSADLILLDDATPAIDVMINLPPDTTGTIAIEITSASVQLRDVNDTVVFSATDARLHKIELNIAPNTGSHTLTIERMPDVASAYVKVTALTELTINGTVQLTDSTDLTLNQETELALDANNLGGTVSVNIPSDTIGVVTANFLGADATTQLVDDAGAILAQSAGGHVDGITFVLDAGEYSFILFANNLMDTIVTGVRVVSAEDTGVAVLEAPEMTSPENTTALQSCTATIASSSVNLRSGPGTGYSVLDYGYHGEVLPIGGQNLENNWIVVGTADGGSAWLAKSLVNLQGSCDTLTVFNIPFRDAPVAQIIITAPITSNPVTTSSDVQYQTNNTNNNSSSSSHENDHDDDHEDDHEDDRHERDDD